MATKSAFVDQASVMSIGEFTEVSLVITGVFLDGTTIFFSCDVLGFGPLESFWFHPLEYDLIMEWPP